MIPLARRPSVDSADDAPPSIPRQAVRFLLHVAAAYLIVWFSTPWIAARIYDWLSSARAYAAGSRMQFLYSNLFALTFVPGALAGLINAKYRHRIASFVWTIPLVLLLYKLCVFPTSVMQDHWRLALRYYFDPHFVIPEFHSYKEMFSLMTPGSDMVRGVDQLYVTGFLYAGLGYSLAAFAAPHLRRKRVDQRFFEDPS